MRHSCSYRIVAGAQDSDIVFLHDTSQRSMEATEMTRRNLSEKGFIFVAVESLIKRHGPLVAGQIYKTGNADCARLSTRGRDDCRQAHHCPKCAHPGKSHGTKNLVLNR